MVPREAACSAFSEQRRCGVVVSGAPMAHAPDAASGSPAACCTHVIVGEHSPADRTALHQQLCPCMKQFPCTQHDWNQRASRAAQLHRGSCTTRHGSLGAHTGNCLTLSNASANVTRNVYSVTTGRVERPSRPSHAPSTPQLQRRHSRNPRRHTPTTTSQSMQSMPTHPYHDIGAGAATPASSRVPLLTRDPPDGRSMTPPLWRRISALLLCTNTDCSCAAHPTNAPFGMRNQHISSRGPLCDNSSQRLPTRLRYAPISCLATPSPESPTHTYT